jgi:hypothetical protein
MAITVDTLPQNRQPIRTITIVDLVSVLPETIPFRLNIWIAGKIARFGKTTENLLFLGELKEFPSVEMRQFFGQIGEALGVQATISGEWRNEAYQAIRLYNGGRLIVDKTTMTYRELPTEVTVAPVITVDELLAKLPNTVEWKQTLYLTGGLTRNGWSGHDVDFITFDVLDNKSVLGTMSKFFTKTLGWRTDVGSAVMTDREPVYLFKMYEGGVCVGKH